MTAILIRPVVVAPRDVPSVLEMLPAGARVEFDPTVRVTEVMWERKVYSAMVKDLLEAAHPAEWVASA